MAVESFSETPTKGSRRRTRNEILGVSEFPTASGGDGKFDGERNDLDQRNSLGLYRCFQCGFLNDERRVPSQGGTPDGAGGIRVTVTSSVGDPANKRGFCAFCGSANSRKH